MFKEFDHSVTLNDYYYFTISTDYAHASFQTKWNILILPKNWRANPLILDDEWKYY